MNATGTDIYAIPSYPRPYRSIIANCWKLTRLYPDKRKTKLACTNTVNLPSFYSLQPYRLFLPTSSPHCTLPTLTAGLSTKRIPLLSTGVLGSATGVCPFAGLLSPPSSSLSLLSDSPASSPSPKAARRRRRSAGVSPWGSAGRWWSCCCCWRSPRAEMGLRCKGGGWVAVLVWGGMRSVPSSSES